MVKLPSENTSVFVVLRIFKLHSNLGQSVINIFVHSLDMNISLVFELLNTGEGSFYDFFSFNDSLLTLI